MQKRLRFCQPSRKGDAGSDRAFAQAVPGHLPGGVILETVKKGLSHVLSVPVTALACGTRDTRNIQCG